MTRNNYFQFKQFKVLQENAAMKVGTDGVLLGAWANIHQAETILDIGTGTGLIALMLVQRSNAQIDAIDLDPGAFNDAQLNFKNSPWSERLHPFQTSLQEFSAQTSIKYDCIVCNPPFFENALKSPNEVRSLARHTDSLSYSELSELVAKLLLTKGFFNIVLPIEMERNFRNEASLHRLFPTKITRVKSKPSKPFKRVLMEFQLEASNCSEDELIIETEIHHDYTPDFEVLLKDFYLKL